MVGVATSGLVVRHFQEQHYSVIFNANTGFFVRLEELGHEEPFWSWHGPELLDIAITNWCDKECAICYRASSRVGKHMPLVDYEKIIQQARNMCVFQVALGGGNPNQHPDFCEILRQTRERYGIVPCYTTNGRGLTDEVLKASREYCGAVAVSAYGPYEEMRNAVRILNECGVRSNIHFVLTRQSIETAIRWLESPPDFLDNINAIVFLNYKPVGRSNDAGLLLAGSSRLAEFFSVATGRRHKFKVGFDSCLVSGLAKFTHVPGVYFDRCDAGRFSMFVSEDMEMYPCSFMVQSHQGIPIEQGNMLEAWRAGELFVDIRNRLAGSRCQMCGRANLCLGGCPVLEEINVCS